MNKDTTYVLIHSPLVGGLTWRLVADEMREHGLKVVVPLLKDLPDTKEPFWKQHAKSVSQELSNLSNDKAVTLVAHSGAGPLLPIIRETMANPVNAYVFVDAGLPRDGASRLDLMREEDLQWAEQFQAELERGGQFPNWSMDDLQDVIPDEVLRRQMVAEIHPRGLPFFMEPIPVFNGWPDAPCVYVQFSDTYAGAEIQARRSGWKTYKLDAMHFHMLIKPKTIMDMLVEATP